MCLWPPPSSMFRLRFMSVAMLAGCTFTMILAIVLKAGRRTHLECVAEIKLQLFDWGLPETNDLIARCCKNYKIY